MGNRHAGRTAVLAAVAALMPFSPCEAATPPTVADTAQDSGK